MRVTRRHQLSIPWDILGLVAFGVGWGLRGKTDVALSVNNLLPWLAPKADLGRRRRQGGAFVVGWIAARGLSSQIAWEGDNLFF